MLQTIKELKTNLTYRWFNGADINFRDQNPTAAIGGYAPYDVMIRMS